MRYGRRSEPCRRAGEARRRWSVEGGPLIVHEVAVTALMYAVFNGGMFYAQKNRREESWVSKNGAT